MEKELTLTQMEVSIVGNGRTIRCMDMASFIIPPGNLPMKGSGIWITSMARGMSIMMS